MRIWVKGSVSWGLVLVLGLVASARISAGEMEEEEARLEVGKTIEGEITEEDPVIETEILHPGYSTAPVRGRTFRVEVTESGPYHIELKSYFFDAYLVLRNAEGVVLAEDDDGLLATHSRIVRKLEVGKSYQVDACALHGGTGSFEILVTAGMPRELSPRDKMGKSIEDARESLRRVEIARGPDHVDVATSLSGLAHFLEAQGEYEEARPLYERSLAILEKSLGPDHRDVARGLNNLAVFLKTQGEYEEARPLCERSLAIWEKSLGPDHPEVALTLNNLARLLMVQGEYEEARPLFERALLIREKSLGPDHRDVAASLNNLAVVLKMQGEYEEARPLYERSLAILEKSLGPDHPDVAQSMNNLGGLFMTQGEYEEARPLFERSLAILEESLGPDHPYVAQSLNSLASLLETQGQYEESRPLYERSLAIREKSLGPDHPDVAQSLNNLAKLRRTQGHYQEARPLCERSLAIREKSLGPDHPDVAKCLSNLALFFEAQGHYEEARPLHERSLAIREKSLGPDHPSVAIGLHNLALLEADVGNIEKASDVTRRALLIQESELEANLGTQTESERIMFARLFRSYLEFYLSLLGSLAAEGKSTVVEEVTSTVLSWKGRATRELLGTDRLRFAAHPLEEQALIQDIRRAQKALSDALYSREVTDRKAHGRKLETLRNKSKALERDLALRRGEREGEKVRGDAWQRGEESAVLRLVLPPHSVAVDFFVHRCWKLAEWKGKERISQGHWAPRRVSAFVIRPGDNDPLWLDLGEARILEETTAAFLQELVTEPGVFVSKRGLSSPIEFGEGETTPVFRLRELLWDPLREAIGDAELVILSPDTFLGTLPFETLQEKDGSFLIEHHSFVYLQDLMSLLETKPRKTDVSPSLLAAGAIDYRRRGKLEAEPAVPSLVARLETRGGLPEKWARLSFTGQEADAITGFFEEMTEDEGDSTLLLGKEATEEAIKREMSRHTHVHLATHGYFQPDSLPSAWRNAGKEVEKMRDGLFLEETERTITGLLPGLLSGLVFAGANAEPEEGRDNGLLTAEEVTFLDLSGCDLVVLSACETGLGRAEAGEGMLGLRRSFRLAGARTVVSSLWQVRDDSTQELMERFYENLWLKKMGKLEALRQAQLWMLEENREGDGKGLPSTWGAFVLDGEWE